MGPTATLAHEMRLAGLPLTLTGPEFCREFFSLIQRLERREDAAEAIAKARRSMNQPDPITAIRAYAAMKRFDLTPA